MALVGAMCTSGTLLQLAIAPAGAGKTTATRSLIQAWTDSGGTVVGLPRPPPQLRDSTTPPAHRPKR